MKRRGRSAGQGQQRSSRGCWPTLDGLADFAVVQSYVSITAKWGISKLDALRDLFNGRPWMPTRTRTHRITEPLIHISASR